MLGDLVTLPAPFFETACPARWQAALDEVWATAVRLGGARTRRDDDPGAVRRLSPRLRRLPWLRRRRRGAAECAAGWTRDVGEFLASDADRTQATRYAAYYVDFLRKGGGASPDCASK